MRVLYIKDHIVVNIVEHETMPTSAPDCDHVFPDYGAQVGDHCEKPYALTAIEAEEKKQARALREAILTGDKIRLQQIENTIATLRTKL